MQCQQHHSVLYWVGCISTYWTLLLVLEWFSVLQRNSLFYWLAQTWWRSPPGKNMLDSRLRKQIKLSHSCDRKQMGYSNNIPSLQTALHKKARGSSPGCIASEGRPRDKRNQHRRKTQHSMIKTLGKKLLCLHWKRILITQLIRPKRRGLHPFIPPNQHHRRWGSTSFNPPNSTQFSLLSGHLLSFIFSRRVHWPDEGAGLCWAQTCTQVAKNKSPG